MKDAEGPVDEALKSLLEDVDVLLKTGTSETRREAYSKLTAYLNKVSFHFIYLQIAYYG